LTKNIKRGIIIRRNAVRFKLFPGGTVMKKIKEFLQCCEADSSGDIIGKKSMKVLWGVRIVYFVAFTAAIVAVKMKMPM